MGLSHRLWQNNRFVYPLTAGSTACVSVIYALDAAGLPLGFLGTLCRKLPLYSMGFCWVSVALIALAAGLAAGLVRKKK
jgi:branched-subunit amino acid permease